MINDEKRLLQQYRPLSSVAVMQQIGSDRKESGHHADIVDWSKMTVGSTGRCNTGIESLYWGFKSQCLTRPFVELTRHFIQMSLRVN